MIELKLDHYVPSLRWRQGEYQALLALKDSAKARTVPLITIPPIEYDFEAGKLKHTIHEHVEPFPKRYNAKWGRRPAWIDINESLYTDTMKGGEHVVDYVFDSIRKFNTQAVPVLTIGSDTSIATRVAKAILADKRGLGLRARFEDIMRPTFTQSARELIKKISLTPFEVDLILDLGSPN